MTTKNTQVSCLNFISTVRQIHKIQKSTFNRTLYSRDCENLTDSICNEVMRQCEIRKNEDSFVVQTLMLEIFNLKLGKNLVNDLSVNDSFDLILIAIMKS